MKKKKAFNTTQSSYLVSWPVVILLFLVGIFLAFKGFSFPAAILIILFLFALISRLWGMFSVKKIEVKVRSNPNGLFPGDKFFTNIKVTNGKFLPVIWLSMNFPLGKDPVLIPDEGKIREFSEVDKTENENMKIMKVAEVKLPSLLWYENFEKQISWTAKRRGVFKSDGWRLATGDGLGLCQAEIDVDGRRKDGTDEFAVYPEFQEVRTDELIKNIWNGQTGAKGIADDITVIRSSRDYEPYDNSKFINWRLLARGLKMQVNTYEQILPGNIHVIFDGESFSSPVINEELLKEKVKEDADALSKPVRYLEELEDALSVISSELIMLDEKGINCGITLSKGEALDAISLFGESSSLEERLFALSAYEPLKLVYNDDNQTLKIKEPDFDIEKFKEKSASINKIFFITYDAESAKKRKVLSELDASKTTVITYINCDEPLDFNVMSIQRLKAERGL